jgi:hypothetical protein
MLASRSTFLFQFREAGEGLAMFNSRVSDAFRQQHSALRFDQNQVTAYRLDDLRRGLFDGAARFPNRVPLAVFGKFGITLRLDS